MNTLKRLSYRIYQKTMFVASCFMHFRNPKLIEGADSQKQIAQILVSNKKQRTLIVTDKSAIQRGDLQILQDSFDNSNLQYFIFDGVLPNPTIEQIEQGLKIFNTNKCDSIVAFGGGSVIDCAKIIGARAVKPNKTVEQLKGLLKINARLPLFVAVPTTAGTGSEVTVAAVVSNAQTHEKYAINDLCLIPHYAVLDANLTVKLPPMLTATTGMDALTHAVEAFVGHSNTGKTKQQAMEAVKLVFENLEKAYTNGKDIEARQNMQKASYLAGQAFTRAYVGYVHAMAHALGGKYGVPHGLANAVILPTVLFAYGKHAHKQLAKLADCVGIKGENTQQKAMEFVWAIQDLNSKMNIPATIPQEYDAKQSDICRLANTAIKEANPLYPVPYILDTEDLQALFTEVL